MKNAFFLLLFFFLSSYPLKAELTPQAKAYLSHLPEKKLTLPYVIKTALENAEAYKVLAYQKQTAELEELGQIESLTDTVLMASGQYADDNSAKNSGFQPLRAKQWKYNLGLSKDWSTGTKTSVGWDYDTNNLEFFNNPGISNIFINQYKQSAAVISIEQNLLKNGFGHSFRNKRTGARKRGEAIEWKVREELEELTLKFILVYYQAWTTQQQVKSLADQVERQKGLVQVLTKRNQKGAIESPDLIQIEALLEANKTKLDITLSELVKQWESLVISLKLPIDFLNINPVEIPLSVDNPIPLGMKVCEIKEPNKTAKIAALEKKLEGLDADFKAAKNESLPDLKLLAGYKGNSIDSSASVTMQNVLAGSDNNGFGRGPAWNIGMKLVWPLNNSAAKALRTKKYIEKEQTAAELRSAIDDLKIDWRDLCRRLKMESLNETTFKNVVLKQKKRVRAEQRRFQLGRSSVSQLVTAEDDLGIWEFNSQQKEIEVRKLSWQVQKYSGELYKNIDSTIEVLFKGQVQ